jgi:DnaJ-domain-containing protein 1
VTRPLMQNGIAELERMFDSSQGEPQMLEALESELKFRSVPRATTLLNKVRQAINGAPVVPAASQEALFEDMLSPPARQTQVSIAMTASDSATPEKREPEPPLQVSVEDACKILKVAPNASWDSIEQSRRAIVELARPDRLERLGEEKRHAVRLHALKANAALNALLQARRAR